MLCLDIVLRLFHSLAPHMDTNFLFVGVLCIVLK